MSMDYLAMAQPANFNQKQTLIITQFSKVLKIDPF